MESKMSRDELTLDILKQIADSLIPFLKFTGECSKEGTPIACLDTQLWMGFPNGDEWYSGAESPG